MHDLAVNKMYSLFYFFTGDCMAEKLKIHMLRSVAHHLRQGKDNGGIEKDVLALFLTDVADYMEKQESEIDNLKTAIEMVNDFIER